jgi:hypothetical protein
MLRAARPCLETTCWLSWRQLPYWPGVAARDGNAERHGKISFPDGAIATGVVKFVERQAAGRDSGDHHPHPRRDLPMQGPLDGLLLAAI